MSTVGIRYADPASEVFDASLRYQIRLLGMTADEVHRATDEILAPGEVPEKVEEFVHRLKKAVKNVPPPKWGKAMTDVHADFRGKQLDAAGEKAMESATATAEEAARHESGMLGALAAVKHTFDRPSTAYLVNHLKKTRILDRLPGEWFKHLSDTEAKDVAQMVSRDLSLGLPHEDVAKQVRDRLKLTNAHARTIARTMLQSASAEARKSVWALNSDIIVGARYVATLDGRTSPICQARDGEIYPLDKMPVVPAHPNCRSTLIPVLKGSENDGSDGVERPAVRDTRTRQEREKAFLAEAKAYAGDAKWSRMTVRERRKLVAFFRSEWKHRDIHHTPANITYSDWLHLQPEEFQNQVLGEDRADLFRNGMPLSSFVNMKTGRKYTLKELRVDNASEKFTGGKGLAIKKMFQENYMPAQVIQAMGLPTSDVEDLYSFHETWLDNRPDPTDGLAFPEQAPQVLQAAARQAFDEFMSHNAHPEGFYNWLTIHDHDGLGIHDRGFGHIIIHPATLLEQSPEDLYLLYFKALADTGKFKINPKLGMEKADNPIVPKWMADVPSRLAQEIYIHAMHRPPGYWARAFHDEFQDEIAEAQGHLRQFLTQVPESANWDSLDHFQLYVQRKAKALAAKKPFSIAPDFKSPMELVTFMHVKRNQPAHIIQHEVSKHFGKQYSLGTIKTYMSKAAKAAKAETQAATAKPTPDPEPDPKGKKADPADKAAKPLHPKSDDKQLAMQAQGLTQQTREARAKSAAVQVDPTGLKPAKIDQGFLLQPVETEVKQPERFGKAGLKTAKAVKAGGLTPEQMAALDKSETSPYFGMDDDDFNRIMPFEPSHIPDSTEEVLSVARYSKEAKRQAIRVVQRATWSPGRGQLTSQAAADKAAISAYTGESYDAVNKALRAGRRFKNTTLDAYAEALTEAAMRQPRVTKVVERGIKLRNPKTMAKYLQLYREGSIIEEQGFVSTSYEGIPEGFKGGVRIRMLGVDVYDIAALSNFKDEKEALIPPGTRWVVRHSRLVDGQLQVDLVQVKNGKPVSDGPLRQGQKPLVVERDVGNGKPLLSREAQLQTAFEQCIMSKSECGFFSEVHPTDRLGYLNGQSSRSYIADPPDVRQAKLDIMVDTDGKQLDVGLGISDKLEQAVSDMVGESKSIKEVAEAFPDEDIGSLGWAYFNALASQPTQEILESKAYKQARKNLEVGLRRNKGAYAVNWFKTASKAFGPLHSKEFYDMEMAWIDSKQALPAPAFPDDHPLKHIWDTAFGGLPVKDLATPHEVREFLRIQFAFDGKLRSKWMSSAGLWRAERGPKLKEEVLRAFPDLEGKMSDHDMQEYLEWLIEPGVSDL